MALISLVMVSPGLAHKDTFVTPRVSKLLPGLPLLPAPRETILWPKLWLKGLTLLRAKGLAIPRLVWVRYLPVDSRRP